MDHHARVLQQRIEVAAVGRRRASRRSNGFDVSSMNSRKPTLTRPITPSTRAVSVVGQVCAEAASTARPAGQHQHPQQQRAFVRAPRAGEPVVQRQRASCECGATFGDREVVVDEAVREAAEGDRDEHELRARGRPRERHPGERRRARRRRAAACPATSGDERARGSSANWPSSGIIASAPSAPALASVPAFFERVLRLRAACSSRRAWRAPRSR